MDEVTLLDKLVVRVPETYASEKKREKQKHFVIYKNPINSEYFKKLNTRNAYMLGYLFADGHFRKRKIYSKLGIGFKIKFGLCFSSIDKELIIKIKKELGIENRKTGIKLRKDIHRKKTYIIYISDYHFLRHLENLGMIYGKKFDRIIIPKMIMKNKLIFFSFFRGFFDGDGTVTSILYAKYARVGIDTASYKFLVQMKKIMKQFGILSDNILIHNNSNYSTLRFSGKENVYNLYRFMYRKSNGLFLTRKKRRFEEFFKSYNWKIYGGIKYG